MGNKRMRAEKRIFCKRQGLVDTRKLWRILYLVLTVSLFLAGCGQAADNDGTDILPERVQKDSVGQGESGKMGEAADSIAVIRPDGEEIDWAVYSEGVYCYSKCH